MRYKVASESIDGRSIAKLDDQGNILITFTDPSPGNGDWAEFQSWIAAGNEPAPLPVPPPIEPAPSIAERLQAAETLINLILDEEAQ